MEKKINKTKNKITVSRIRTIYNIKGIQLKIYQFYLLFEYDNSRLDLYYKLTRDLSNLFYWKEDKKENKQTNIKIKLK